MTSAGHPRILAGRYRLEEVIGRGGMSTIYRATDLALDRVVAVKVALDPLAEENPVYVARFKREARAAAALNHPGVVTIYDAGADGPTRFIAMEYVDGRSLSDILRDEARLEPSRAAHVAEQIADTLTAAHAAGIIHRDIKPGNVMLTAGDRVKVLDFGIARTADAVTLTQTASVLGTAPYMAPEQAMGNPADARSDIYSLGCVLYEMLTGRPPFMADVPAAVLHQHVRVPVTPPSERNPSVPPALDALVLQMLAKAPENRPQTAAEVRDRLAACESGTPTAPTRALPPVAPRTEPTEALPPAVEALAAAAAAEAPQVATVPQAATNPPQATRDTRVLPPPARKPRRALWATLAAIAVLLLGAAVALALTGTGSTASSSASTPSHSSGSATARSTAVSTSSSHAGSTPTTSSTSSTTTTSSTPTTTTTTTTTATNPSTSSTTGAVPPGQGGTPPGQAKKGNK